MRKRLAGFTLIELIITVSIAATLLTIGIPSFVNTIRANRLAATTNEFTAALLSARSEAIKRNQPIVICSSSTGTSCNAPSGWEAGWMSFVDADGDSNYDAGEVILNVHGAVTGGLWIRGNNNVANKVTYSSLGLLKANLIGGAFMISFGGDTSNPNNLRVMCVAITGRSRVMPPNTFLPNAGGTVTLNADGTANCTSL